MAVPIPLHYKRFMVYMLISILGCIIFSPAKIHHSVASVAAFTLQQQQQYPSQVPARCNLCWKRPSLVLLHPPTPRQSIISLYVISHNRHFWSLTHLATRMMSQPTATTESTSDTMNQVRPDRPELVLSVKDYLQNDAASSDDTNNADNRAATKIQLVLASASPRRREILNMMGLQSQYIVIPSPLNETQIQLQLRQTNQIDPIRYTRTLAEQKAYAVAYDLLSQQSVSTSELYHPPTTRLILGSDTVVAITDECTNTTTLLEKPIDSYDAIRMLQQLQNRSHIVYTGVALVRFTPSSSSSSLERQDEAISDNEDVAVPDVQVGYFQDNQLRTIQLVQSFVETATVHISAMNDVDIAAYVATQEPMDKAGAYGIQGIGGQLVTKIDGDFFTVRVMIFVVLRQIM